MLDPLTAISLASAVVQFTDFGIELVRGSIEVYHSANGVNSERSNLELKITHARKLADSIISPFEHNENDGLASGDGNELRKLAESSKRIANDLLSVLNDLKVKKPAGSGRKLESFRKAVAAQTPHNKNKIAVLEKELLRVQEEMLSSILFMMRYITDDIKVEHR